MGSCSLVSTSNQVRSVQRLTSKFPSFKSPNNFEKMAAPFPEIKSTQSLVAKHVTPEKWEKLAEHKTATSGFTLAKAIACAVEFDDQHCGIYAGDADSYVDFADVFTPIICEYHGLDEEFKHTSDMDASKIKGNINPNAPVKSTRIRVGRSINGLDCLLESPRNNDWRL